MRKHFKEHSSENISDVISSVSYIIKFNEPDIKGIIFTKNSFDYTQFDKLKENGEIVDYFMDDIGIKIIKRINKNNIKGNNISISSRK
jgi:hypothetical protein